MHHAMLNEKYLITSVSKHISIINSSLGSVQHKGYELIQQHAMPGAPKSQDPGIKDPGHYFGEIRNISG